MDVSGQVEQIKRAARSLKEGLAKSLNGAPEASEASALEKKGADTAFSESSTSYMRSLVGPVTDIGDFYFPPDIIGGVCPRVAGEEEAIVWNAAVEACDSERVHVVWQSIGNRIWFLAVKSADLASNPNAWCPLAALLPTTKDMANAPCCYAYYGEEFAVMMVVAPEELRIFRGTGSVIKAKAERVEREYGGKMNAVTIDLFRIGQMTPVPWYSVSLFEDRARRILAAVSVFVSLGIVGFSFLVWLLASMAAVSARHDLAETQERTQTKTLQLMKMAENMRSSPLRERIEKFLGVNEGLLAINGLLNIYSIKDQVIRWKALVPPSVTADRISALGAKNMETTDKGVLIGNDAQIDYEKMSKEKR